MKTKYHGIAIEYIEREDVWLFELRGKERKSSSLKLAKEEIDKKPPKGKASFLRHKAWHPDWKDGIVAVDVTSIAAPEQLMGESTKVWIIDDEKQRQQVRPGKLWADTPKNAQIVKLILEKIALGKEIDNAVSELKKTLVVYTLPQNVG
jgi:hypothetical protein